MMHSFLMRRCLAILLSMGLLASPAVGADYTPIDKLELLDLLGRGEYATLDELFSEYEKAVEAGEMNEKVIRYAFGAFKHSDPDTATRLDDWVRARPDSYAALLARAVHRAHIAVLYRGDSLPASAPRERVQAVHENFRLAVADAKRALEINGKAATAYGLLIVVGVYSGQTGLRDWALERGLAAVPNSVVIRMSYLFGLLSWWGGSPAEVRAFLDESNQVAELGSLKGYYDYAKALSLGWKGQRRKAREYFDRALRFEEDVLYLYHRGLNLYYGGLDDRGLADLNRVLELSPHWPRALSTRARVFASQGEYEKAYEDWRLALKLDPLNPRILRHRAHALEKQGRYAEALEDLDKALVYAAFYPEIRSLRGQLKIAASNDRKAAREELRRATELAPYRGEYWYHYAEALTEGPLSQKRECKAVAAFMTYLKLCRRTNSCDSNNISLAEHFTKQRPKRYGWCL